MAEPFKNLYNRDVVTQIGRALARSHPAFPEAHFIEMATAGLESLELKARWELTRTALEATLPADFPTAAAAIIGALHPERTGFDRLGPDAMAQGVFGWAIIPLAEYVGRRGQGHFELALATQRELTQRATAEFGIRHLIAADPERALATILTWTQDANEHVRRLASEGTRPRLPWGLRLKCFIERPELTLPILTALRDDPSEYVRRSVANHLNDIAKDHPELVVQIGQQWLVDAPPAREKLVRHALRTLLKQGHEAALETQGIAAASWRWVDLEVLTPEVPSGGELSFRLGLHPTAAVAPLRLDYAIHHRKANGQLSPKVFRWKVIERLEPTASTQERRHSFKPVTTRRYYPGEHAVEVFANGQSVAKAGFILRG